MKGSTARGQRENERHSDVILLVVKVDINRVSIRV